MKTKISIVFACALLTAALAAPAPANAQVAGATAGVQWLNRFGGSVGCNPPTSTGAALGTCIVNGSASGGLIDNFCREFASVSAPPAGANVLLDGCSVTLNGSITAVMSTVGQANETAVYTCFGAGLGTLTYNPAAGSKGVAMRGPVVLTYENGVLTANGALFNLGPVTVGEGNATIVDPCGPDDVPFHPFAGEINI